MARTSAMVALGGHPRTLVPIDRCFFLHSEKLTLPEVNQMQRQTIGQSC